MARAVWRIFVLLVLAGLSLQLYFVGRIALMNVLAPQSTTFQRSEFVRILTSKGRVAWSQTWMPGEAISNHLRRAVIASEDANFADHDGVEWDALENAWKRNSAAKARADKRQADILARHQRAVERARKRGRAEPPPPNLAAATPKVIGGSTITQQLAKNLFLTGERTLLRKGQELVLALMLEALLSKERLLEIYLNHVEWGAGIFGAEAAAQHYYKKPAARLSPREAARLAVMLPSPKFFERRQNSAYLERRAGTIAARMSQAQLP